MTEPYKYVHIDPARLPPSDLPPFQGTRSACLASACLDVIHAGIDAGLSMDDVDKALVDIISHVSMLHRDKFKVHHGA
jgi:hypothetical protein